MLAEAEIKQIKTVVAEDRGESGREERNHDREQAQQPAERGGRRQAHRALGELALAYP